MLSGDLDMNPKSQKNPLHKKVEPFQTKTGKEKTKRESKVVKYY
jgi:hypothetical protein